MNDTIRTLALILAAAIIVPVGLVVLWVTETLHNRKLKP
jgi:hypothetical protein